MRERPLQPAHVLGGLGRPLDPRVFPRQLAGMGSARIRLRCGKLLAQSEIEQGRHEEVAAVTGERSLQRRKVGVGREAGLHARVSSPRDRWKRGAEKSPTHRRLHEDPSAVEALSAQFLHGDAAIEVAGEDAPLDRGGASPAREERGVNVQGVQGFELGEERGRDQVTERGGQEQIPRRAVPERVGGLSDRRVRYEWPRLIEEGPAHLPAFEEGLFRQGDGRDAEFFGEQSQAGCAIQGGRDSAR